MGARVKIPRLERIPQLEKKLGEADTFLNHLRRESRRVGDVNFKDYLSAFLVPTRSITEPIGRSKKHKPWFERWEANLDLAERQLLHTMTDQRRLEVHQDGADVAVEYKEIPINGEYRDEFCTISVSAPPPTVTGTASPPAAVRRPVRYFLFRDGTRHEVVETCTHYYALLQRLVLEFRQAQQ